MTLRNNYIKSFVIAITAISISYNGNAQTKNEFSVKQTVDYGLKNSLTVKNALLDIKLQQQSNKEITSAALPQVSGNASIDRYFNIGVQPINDFITPAVYDVLHSNHVKNDSSGIVVAQPDSTKNKTLGVAFGTPWVASAGVTLNQVLFDGQVFVGLQARRTAILMTQKSVEVTQEQIKANIYKIYYQLVVGQKQLASVQSNIDNINKQLHDTKEIYKNGFAEKLDIDKLTVQLNNLQTQKDVLINQLAAGNAGLKFLISMPQKEELILTDTLSEDELKANILDESYNYDDRKDVQLMTINSKLYQYNVKRYQLSGLPKLSLIGNYTKNSFGSDLSFISNATWYTSSYVGLNLNVPIFDGLNRRAKLQEAKYTLEKNKNSIEQLKQSIDNEVVQARISMKSALATIDNQKQNTQLAQQVFNSTTLKYAQGLGSNQEIYDAQTQLQVAQNNYYNALYDAIIAKINYLQATGKL